jgi:hypothetical protein
LRKFSTKKVRFGKEFYRWKLRKLCEVLISKENLGNPAFDMESLLGPACFKR